MSMQFTPSDPHTIGIELELQLLDPNTLDLVDGIMPLMEFYPNAIYVKPEFIQNTVEVSTKVCTSCDELAVDLASVVRGVHDRCEQLGMALCGAGTHPFSQRLALITPQPRYKRMERSGGYQSHIQITFATHVHVGVESGQQAIEVMDQLRPYLSLLIAISANSPFWRGHETGYVSYRHRILAAARSYGIPPTFGSWDRFVDFMRTTTKAGIFDTINDIHWDIRPRPHLGTIEVRLMDAQSTVSEAISLAAFIRALVTFVRELPTASDSKKLSQALHWWLEKDNQFQASRQGLKANFVFNEDGESERLEAVWKRVFKIIRPIAESLGDGLWLERLQENISNGPGYLRQLRQHQANESLPDLVSELTKELEQDLFRFHRNEPVNQRAK